MVIYTVLTLWITSWRCGPGLRVIATGGRVDCVPGWALSRAPAIRFALNLRAILVPNNAPLMLCSRMAGDAGSPSRIPELSVMPGSPAFTRRYLSIRRSMMYLLVLVVLVVAAGTASVVLDRRWRAQRTLKETTPAAAASTSTTASAGEASDATVISKVTDRVASALSGVPLVGDRLMRK